ncbi:MAG: hypothetical protein K6C69_06800 [Lachnospiraceae bacterium]|nr:hypothetical protein [Lachnospiraceae bacterium]
MNNNDFYANLDKIRRLYLKQEYEEAIRIADKMDFKKLKDWKYLATLINLYEAVGRLEDVRYFCTLAYNRNLGGKKLVYKLCKVNIRMEDIDESEELYDEYCQMTTPKDLKKYELLYELKAVQGAKKTELINILEDFMKKKLDDKYCLTLAELYMKTKQKDKAIAFCERIANEYEEGEIAEQAKAMKLAILNPEAAPPIQIRKPGLTVETTTIGLNGNTGEVVIVPEASGNAADAVRKALAETGQIPLDGIRAVDPSLVATGQIPVENLYATGQIPVENLYPTGQIPDVNAPTTQPGASVPDPSFGMTQEVSVKEEGVSSETAPLGATQAISSDEINEALKKNSNEMLGTTQQISVEATMHPGATQVIPVDHIKDAVKNTSSVAQTQVLPETAGIAETQVVPAQESVNQEAAAVQEASAAQAAPQATQIAPQPAQAAPSSDTITAPASAVTDGSVVNGQTVALDDINHMGYTKELHNTAILGVAEAATKEEQLQDAVTLGKNVDTQEINHLGYTKELRNTAILGVSAQEALGAEPQDETAGVFSASAAGMNPGNPELAATQAVVVQAPEAQEGTPGDTISVNTVIMSEEVQQAAQAAQAAQTAAPADMSRTVEIVSAAIAKETRAAQFDAAMVTGVTDGIVGGSNASEPEVAKPTLKAFQPELDVVYPIPEEVKRYFVRYNDSESTLAQIGEYFESTKYEQKCGTSGVGNIIIAGNRSADKTTLAINIVKALTALYPENARKIARTTGDNLNQRGIQRSIAKLTGASLIIEDAGVLDRQRVLEMVEAMEGNTGELLIILEDTENEIAELLKGNPELLEKFNHRITYRQFTVNEMVEMCKRYAETRGYVIDEKALLQLYLRIDGIHSGGDGVSLQDVRDVVDDAIDSANKRAEKKLFGGAKKKKVDDKEYIILNEHDFKE